MWLDCVEHVLTQIPPLEGAVVKTRDQECGRCHDKAVNGRFHGLSLDAFKLVSFDSPGFQLAIFTSGEQYRLIINGCLLEARDFLLVGVGAHDL